MLRLVLLAALAGAAAVTRETVRRMVVVRTTGSDLAPAATGYLYHKSDAGESVVRMADADVARLAAGRPAAGPVDGLADFDYSKLFADYGARDERDYDDYFKRIKDEFHHKYGGRRATDGAPDSEFEPHYGKDGDGYRNAKFESYSFSGGREQRRRAPASYEVYDNSERDHDHHFPGAPLQHYAEGDRSSDSQNFQTNAAECEASPDRPATDTDLSAVRAANSAEQPRPSEAPGVTDEASADSAESSEASAAAQSYGYEIKH